MNILLEKTFIYFSCLQKLNQVSVKLHLLDLHDEIHFQIVNCNDDYNLLRIVILYWKNLLLKVSDGFDSCIKGSYIEGSL